MSYESSKRYPHVSLIVYLNADVITLELIRTSFVLNSTITVNLSPTFQSVSSILVAVPDVGMVFPCRFHVMVYLSLSPAGRYPLRKLAKGISARSIIFTDVYGSSGPGLRGLVVQSSTMSSMSDTFCRRCNHNPSKQTLQKFGWVTVRIKQSLCVGR